METERQTAYAVTYQLVMLSGAVSTAWTSNESFSLALVNGALVRMATKSATPLMPALPKAGNPPPPTAFLPAGQVAA